MRFLAPWILLTPLLVAGCPDPDAEAKRTLAKARAFYQSKPQYMRPFPYTPLPRGLPDLRAETCGACHRAIYSEWRVSTHARAWLDDAQFQEELHKSRKQGVDWMCVNCHTPLVNQLPELVVGLRDGELTKPIKVKNPRFDKRLQRDAITCAVCHVRDGVVLGPFGAAKGAPHPVRRAPELLRAELCTRCHQAQHYFKQINLACMFNTGRELRAGWYGKRGYTCQRCHMPEVKRPLIGLPDDKKPTTPVRKTRRHWFGGSLIPKHPRFAKGLAPLRAHYPDGMTLGWQALPERVPAGKRVTLRFRVTNAEAGHMLPTGDPERFILVTATVKGSDGRKLARRQERFGSLYRWSPEIKLVRDTRLAPKDTRSFTLDIDVPKKASALRVELVATKHRISDENVKYHHLEGRVVPSRRFFSKTRTIRVDAGSKK
ncbi:MAG: hypothetical protein KC503_24300 [Myxococcales bacterium]|nr:hypothetical protein [Myxococcales bacterium]